MKNVFVVLLDIYGNSTRIVKVFETFEDARAFCLSHCLPTSEGNPIYKPRIISPFYARGRGSLILETHAVEKREEILQTHALEEKEDKLLLLRDSDGEWEYLYHNAKRIDDGHHVNYQIPNFIIENNVQAHKHISIEPSHDCPECLLPYTEIWQGTRELTNMPRELPEDVWNALWLMKGDEA